MKKICTDIEQSNKLIELGIDVNTADMYWDYDYDMYIQREYKYYPRVMDEQFDDTCVPAWSLSALLALMPDKIVVNDENYFLSFTKKSAEYKGIVTWDGQKCISKEAENLLDAAFEMIVWLKENNKL